MGALSNHPFVKMNGLGNEIVVVDMRARPQGITAAEARAAAAAAPYDQLMAVYPSRLTGTDAYVRIFNNDGSEAGACGNGMRCVADILFKESRKTVLAVELQIGPIDRPILHSPSVASMGNPHAIFWVDDVNAYDLGKIGPLLENHPIFPDRANISLAHVISRDHLIVRTWERGAGLTRACGSAACAAVVCASRNELTGRMAAVRLPGGDLDIEW